MSLHEVVHWLGIIIMRYTYHCDGGKQLLKVIITAATIQYMSVIPSVSNEYQAALRWWLGLNTSGGVMCPFCPKTILDSLGLHALTCRHGGDVVIRHNLLRDIIADLCNLFSYSYSKYLHIFANLTGQFSLATRSMHICFLQCPELHVYKL